MTAFLVVIGLCLLFSWVGMFAYHFSSHPDTFPKSDTSFIIWMIIVTCLLVWDGVLLYDRYFH